MRDKWAKSDFVFPSAKGTPLNVSNVLYRFQKVGVTAELPKLLFYDLRHTYTSLLIADGMHPKLIAEQLGHASIQLTMDRYGHLFEGRDKEASAAMDRLFGGKVRSDAKVSEKVVPIRKKNGK